MLFQGEIIVGDRNPGLVCGCPLGVIIRGIARKATPNSTVVPPQNDRLTLTPNKKAA
jgi:hypothetical protein